jgi:hypothetical protein
MDRRAEGREARGTRAAAPAASTAQRYAARVAPRAAEARRQQEELRERERAARGRISDPETEDPAEEVEATPEEQPTTTAQAYAARALAVVQSEQKSTMAAYRRAAERRRG